jgi:hypothetical protein
MGQKLPVSVSATIATLEWLTSTEIARRFRISRNRLIELRRAGVLLAGEHYITQGCRTVWDPAATEQALRAYARLRAEAQIGETYEEAKR